MKGSEYASNTTTGVDWTRLEALYDEQEILIILDWLGWKRPEAMRDVSLEWHHDQPEGGVRLLYPADGYGEHNAVSNAVARVVLSRIQCRLPQWSVWGASERVQMARSYRPARQASVGLMPRHLFTINWADSGPGFSWPEAYYVTFLPGFSRFVVTASQDSPDVHGYTDEAIGHFGRQQVVEKEVGQVILNWWAEQAADGQTCWESLIDEGEVGTATAETWAEEVWV